MGDASPTGPLSTEPVLAAQGRRCGSADVACRTEPLAVLPADRPGAACRLAPD